MENFIRSMQIFVAIVESGSMAFAARQLDLSSSAVSQHINKLELRLNLNLLHRNTRRLTPTEAGELYYQSCKETIRTWINTEQQLNQLQQGLQGELRIAAPVGFAACGVLSQPLQELLHSNDQLNIRLFMQDENLDLISNRIDLALCVRTTPLPDSNLVARKLAEWDMIIAVAPDYLITKNIRKIAATTEHLNKLDWLMHQNNKLSDLRLEGPDNSIVITAKVKLCVNNMQALIQFTKDGLGIAMLPKPEIANELKQGSLLQLLQGWQLPKLSIYAVTGTRESQPVKVQIAIDVLTKALQNYCICSD